MVGVVGAGRMGQGIAHAYLLAGCRVVMVDVDQDACARARKQVAGMLERSAERVGMPVPVDEITELLELATDISALHGCGLVVEAVPEDVSLKRTLLSRVERQLSGDAVLATNTSSISITELATVLSEARRFVGMHFFNPVPASALVEVVAGKATDQGTIEVAQSAVHAIGKEAIVVYDSPGFASSRMGVLLGLEAVRMVEAGVASAEDIDRAMVLGYRHPMGPLRLTDLVGLDVRLSIAEYLYERLGERFEPPQLLRRMVAAGLLGRKTGHGFFHYDDAGVAHGRTA